MSVRVGDTIVAGSSGDVYTKAQVDVLISNAIAQTTERPGMIKPFAGTTVPTGYLLCDGSAISRTTYANLFAVIGTTYGTGDGSTTFNLPNYTDRVAQGLGTGYVAAGLPNTTGSFLMGNSSALVAAYYGNGPFYKTGSSTFYTNALGSQITTENTMRFDLSRTSNIYGGSSTVQPPAIKTYWVIKY